MTRPSPILGLVADSRSSDSGQPCRPIGNIPGSTLDTSADSFAGAPTRGRRTGGCILKRPASAERSGPILPHPQAEGTVQRLLDGPCRSNIVGLVSDDRSVCRLLDSVLVEQLVFVKLTMSGSSPRVVPVSRAPCEDRRGQGTRDRRSRDGTERPGTTGGNGQDHDGSTNVHHEDEVMQTSASVCMRHRFSNQFNVSGQRERTARAVLARAAATVLDVVACDDRCEVGLPALRKGNGLQRYF